MQIKRAKSLLADAHTKLTMVPSMCGYDSNPFFMKLFRNATGLTMRECDTSNGRPETEPVTFSQWRSHIVHTGLSLNVVSSKRMLRHRRKMTILGRGNL